MSLRLEQAICLSLAGGLAVIAPPTFPRTREAKEATGEAQKASEDPAGNPRSTVNKQSRNRSRTAS